MLSGREPVPPGPGADNPLAISPAGAVHCSLGDLAKYAAFHMAGERGKSQLLKAESFKKLHTVVADNDDYALGWMVLKRAWANGRALMHNGSRSEEHTSELQSRLHLVCRLLLEKKKKTA